MFPSQDYPAVLGALVVLNWPVYVAVWRLAFRDRDDLKRSLWYVAVPEMVWVFKRRWLESKWAGARVASSFIVCGVIVLFEYYVICQVIALART
jgi:hypothetical protein